MPLNMDTPEFKRAWAKILAQSWTDEDFKKQLIADPAKVLQEHAIEVPEDTHLTIDQLPLLPFFEGQLAKKGNEQLIGAVGSAYGTSGTSNPAFAFVAPGTSAHSTQLNQPLSASPFFSTIGVTIFLRMKATLSRRNASQADLPKEHERGQYRKKGLRGHFTHLSPEKHGSW